MPSGFRTDLDAHLHGERIWVLDAPLIYWSESRRKLFIVPTGFHTDLSSVPRIPIIYELWGNRAHRPGVLHDAAYRIDFYPDTSFMTANALFFEAIQSTLMPTDGVRWYEFVKQYAKAQAIAYPMYAGVVLCGWISYHKKYMEAALV